MVFCIVEGIDGCGKTSLCNRLQDSGFDAVFTREPYDQSIKDLKGLDQIELSYKFAEDRYMHMRDVVIPAIEAGKHVISDLILQPKFLLQEGFKKCPECGCMPEKGKKCPKCGTMTRTFRPRYYIADFQYLDKKTGKTKIEDVKGSFGFQTDVFKLKWALFEYKYPEKSLEIVVMKTEPKRPKRQAAQMAISEARRIKA